MPSDESIMSMMGADPRPSKAALVVTPRNYRSKTEHNLAMLVNMLPRTLKELHIDSGLTERQFWCAIRLGIKRKIIKSNRHNPNTNVELV